MKNAIFYLSSCDTCRRIIKQIDDVSKFELFDIKKRHITKQELEAISDSSNSSYEDLFNKRAQKFRGIDRSSLRDEDYKSMILEEYTFLKRPIIIHEDKVYIGNNKAIVESAIAATNK